ncbi:MAG TPA: histidine kinase dimerization/phosphoacceptor domain -containing protein [Allosphingosinicella sp.]|nr:histidine kinase dimerization/phosphoacceptor domain -containing protein [Allosphingosinicella sp.]
MLIIMSLALLPLGFLALLGSLQTARENSQKRVQETQARLEIQAQRVDSSLTRSALTIRAASAAIAASPSGSAICETTLRRLMSASGIAGRYALFGTEGDLRCATPGFVPPPEMMNSGGKRSRVVLSPQGQALRFALYDESGAVEGMGEFPRLGLAELTNIPGTSRAFDLDLVQGDRVMSLSDGYKDGPLMQTVRAEAPVADNRLQLKIALSATPLSATEFLMMMLPLLMWGFAAAIAWMLVHWLLLRPLSRMQRAVAAYRPGDTELALPPFRTPAKEIGELGASFSRMTQTVARHEAELEAAVERQRKLVREVHHRVKNNLQVVASLLNLHSRGSRNEDVAAAYASIQRRVDALAVVHRNHYAELEENRGVALRSLISELAANLRATAPASAANMTIRLDVEGYYANQDVAVSVAFLLTEIVEFSMLCGARSVTVGLHGEGGGGIGTARLAVESEALEAQVECDEMLSERFNRIVTGLSRQLRSPLERDEAEGRYSLDIAVVDKADS